jgi:hypothetical protein
LNVSLERPLASEVEINDEKRSWISVHCATAIGSRPATKPKKLRSADRRQ